MTFGWALALQEVAGCTLHECKLPRRQRRLVRTARQRAFGPARVINCADASCIGPVPKDRSRHRPRIDRGAKLFLWGKACTIDGCESGPAGHRMGRHCQKTGWTYRLEYKPTW